MNGCECPPDLPCDCEHGQHRHTVEPPAAPKQRVYLAGPMRGHPDLNFPAFHAATLDLTDRGYDVWSPAAQGLADDSSFEACMAVDLPEVVRADAVVVLPGWQDSQGARIETTVAWRLDKPVLRYPDLKPARHPSSQLFHGLLDEAGRLHDRKQQDYGADDDPFANVRASSTWGVPGWVGALIRLNDKVVRLQRFARDGELANESAIDSMTDIAVYALIARVLYEEAASDA